MSENRRAHSSSRPVNDKGGPAFSEFLNPNAMNEPGAAGVFTMVITNTLRQQFEHCRRTGTDR
jgi:hypothetical protein